MYRIMRDNTSGWLETSCVEADAPAFSAEPEAVEWASKRARSQLVRLAANNHICKPSGEPYAVTVSTARGDLTYLNGFMPSDPGHVTEVKASMWTPVFGWLSCERYVVEAAEE